MMTSALNDDVKDFFLSVPALSGFNGLSGANGGFPGYPSNNTNAYVDACNHAKRYRNKATFSISYDDQVTWGKGQVTDAKNTQYETTIYHGNDGHNDPDWWTNGTTWLNGCLNTIVSNGVGLAGTSTGISTIAAFFKLNEICPNPFNDQLIIFVSEELKGTLNLYSIQGALIQSAQINVTSNELNVTQTLNKLSDLKSGIYILETIGDKGISRNKIIKK